MGGTAGADVAMIGVACAALFAKNVVTGGSFAIARGKAGVRAPEDSIWGPMLWPTQKAPQSFAERPPASKEAAIALARWNRVNQNNLEAEPFGLLLAMAASLVNAQASEGVVEAKSIAVAVGVFTAARIAHNVCYAAGLGPLRTLSFSVGMWSCVFLSYVCVAGAIKIL